MNIFLTEEEKETIKFATINEDDDLNGNDDGGDQHPQKQTDFFLRVKNQMRMNRHAKVIPMTGNGIEVPRMNVSGRVIERDTFQTSRKRGIDTDEISLNGKRVKCAFKVTRGFLDTNVEGMKAMRTLVNIFARKVANSLEQLLWECNTIGHAIIQSDYNNDRDDVGSTTQYVLDNTFNIFDGMIAQAVANGHVVDGANSTDLRRLITLALKELPTMYWDDENIDMLRLYMPLTIVQNLKYILGERRTNMGDIMLNQKGDVTIMGIPVVGLPLLARRPRYVQNLTLTGTTAGALDFGYVDADSVIITPTTLSTSAVTKYVDTTDYVVVETAGTVARSGTSSAISSGQNTKVTFEAPPLFVLTPWDNVLFGVNEDFRFGEFEDIDTDTTLFTIRTRIDFKYQEEDAVVLVKNLQDALPASATL